MGGTEHDDRAGPTARRAGPLQPGDRFANRYSVVRPLGIGGMGAVYEVRDEAVGENVALKIMTLGVGAVEGDVVERFRSEVRTARRVTHRNVARTYDLGEHGGVHFLTMECVDGESLDVVLAREKRLALAAVVRIALQIARGLGAAHAAGVVHRDLKPANVLCERSGRVVITDFGIAHAFDDERGRRTTGVVGTPAYMAPEQIAGSAAGPGADVFAFGVLLHEMLTGALPFSGDSAVAAAVARLVEAPRDPRRLVPQLPEALARLTLRCMAREPGERPASGEGVLTELGAIASSLGIAGPSAPPPLASTPDAARALEDATSDTVALESLGPDTLASIAAVSSRSSPITHATPRSRAVAVLPLRYRGPAGDDYLGEGVAEQVVDALSRTRGLRVLAASACSRYRDERDPRVVGRELGVDVVVDGTLQRHGSDVRITARLIEVATGTQLWSERFSGTVEDVLQLEDRISRRIAEALRVELGTISDDGRQPAEAIELYFRGRRELRRLNLLGPRGALGQFEAALALAPGFKLALAGRAVAASRGWFTRSVFGAPVADAEQVARIAVEQALAQAPELAETHLAAAAFAAQSGDYGAAGQSLATALNIAPTYADAHEYLGTLLCEADRSDVGLEHLRLASDLDPNTLSSLVGIARHAALRGRWAEYDRLLVELRTRGGERSVHMLQLAFRGAVWRGDLEGARAILATLPHGTDMAAAVRIVAVLGRFAFGEASTHDIDALRRTHLAPGVNARFVSTTEQTICEAHLVRGEPSLAISCLVRAADAALVDLEWLDHCPLVAPIRDAPELIEARSKVRARASSIRV